MFRGFERRIELTRTRWTVGKRAAIAVPALAAVMLSAAEVSSLSLSPTEIASGGTSSATVTVTGSPTIASIASTTVSLTSSNTAVATVPASVTVGTKGSKAIFSVHGVAGAAGCPVISARVGASSRTAPLIVQPPAATGLLRVTVPANGTVGGVTVNGQLMWTAVPPAGGVVVQLASSNPNATVPASVTIPLGAVTEGNVAIVPFAIHTTVVAPSTCAVITGTSGGATARALLKIATISG